ncbi:MAG TPA: 30S ribosomal protein S12 methylthiotransferase RimO [Phycisphaerae bacterium]|nr:30S ribosomal protein S12 methylthiotransferase RimO [Phycisphaerae bacterium]
MKKIGIISLGCPKNLVDSEKMLAELAEAGCLLPAPLEEADVILINTCGFLAASRQEALDAIGQALELKHAGSARRVVVAGCLPSRFGPGCIPAGVDAIIGVNDRDKIVQAVCGEGEFVSVCKEAAGFGPGESAGDAGRFRLTPPHTAYLRIAEGCDRKCTFCTIPAIRGPMRSKPLDMVLAEARELIDSGAIELNIIAQDTTAWGEDLGDEWNLSLLLENLDRLDGAGWLRLMYTYPRNFGDELIEAIATAEHVVPYVDMPLQHISSSVLKRMGRRIDRPATEELLHKLRERIDGLVLRTSLIVGFPGESDEEYGELLDFVKKFRFDNLGVFEFSPEEGTPAAKLPGQLPDDVVADRADEIMAVQHEIVLENNRAMVGRKVDVLIDGEADDQACTFGRYYGQAPDIDGLCLLNEPAEPGRILSCTVTGVDDYDLQVTPSSRRQKGCKVKG